MLELNNLFTDKAQISNHEYFETLAKNQGNSQLKRIVSHGQSSPDSGWYCQDFDEWVCVLQGEAEITLKNKDVQTKIHMKSGDYLTIPSKLSHKVSYTSTEPACIWLALYMD